MAIFEEAEQYAAAWYLEHAQPKLSMHNSGLASKLSHRVQEIGVGQQLPSSAIEQAKVAAIFSQVGFALNYEEAIEASRQVVSQYLRQIGAQSTESQSILECLVPNELAGTQASQLYQDAWNSIVFGDEFDIYLTLYRTEKQLMTGEIIRKSVVRSWFYSQMRPISFNTDFAKARYQTILSENKANLENKINKSVAKEQLETELFGGITAEEPTREVQTFFRTSFDYHTKLVDISDNKARIMISVNSILVSVLISLLTYNFQRAANSVNPMVIVPILIFLIAAVGSLIFAILASRPNLTPNDETEVDNMFSFMGFRKFSKKEYQNQMDTLLRDGSAILSSMTAALYALGEILDKKYRYLTISYNVFMVGFVVSILMFMVTYFL